ncbi:MAG: hypothetical protein FJZ95_04325 [Chloroflexi bacterium]|nr:hypothetical protein [Chloroflexota bacterium]
MNKRLMLIAIVVTVAVVLAAFGMVVALEGSDNQPTAVASDFAGCFPSAKVQLTPASFAPAVAKDRAISIANEVLAQSFGVPNPEALPSTATLALFSGETHDGRGDVSDLPVWVVVVRDIPFAPHSVGPRGASETPSTLRSVAPQFNIAIDASTGAIVHSVISGKVGSVTSVTE